MTDDTRLEKQYYLLPLDHEQNEHPPYHLTCTHVT